MTHVSQGARVSVAHASSVAWRGRSFPPDRPCPSRSDARSQTKSRAPAEHLGKPRSRSHRYTPPPSHRPRPLSETHSCPPARLFYISLVNLSDLGTRLLFIRLYECILAFRLIFLSQTLTNQRLSERERDITDERHHVIMLVSAPDMQNDVCLCARVCKMLSE